MEMRISTQPWFFSMAINTDVLLINFNSIFDVTVKKRIDLEGKVGDYQKILEFNEKYKDCKMVGLNLFNKGCFFIPFDEQMNCMLENK